MSHDVIKKLIDYDGGHVQALIMSKELQEACQGLEINGAIPDGLYAGMSGSWPSFLTLIA